MDSLIDVDMRALHDVAARIEAAAEVLRATDLCGPDGLTAADELVGTAAQWLRHLTNLRQAVAGTSVALHAVADAYAAAHEQASRGWIE
jgi:hypothetical protein